MKLTERGRKREREIERCRPSGLVVEDVAMASVSVSGRRRRHGVVNAEAISAVVDAGVEGAEVVSVKSSTMEVRCRRRQRFPSLTVLPRSD